MKGGGEDRGSRWSEQEIDRLRGSPPHAALIDSDEAEEEGGEVNEEEGGGGAWSKGRVRANNPSREGDPSLPYRPLPFLCSLLSLSLPISL